MAGFAEHLASFSVIGLDTAIFIYHFEAHPKYLPLTRVIFRGIETGKWRGAASALTLMEINVRPLSVGREDIAAKYETLLVNYPNLDIVDLNRDVIRLAARLRAAHRIRPPDALHAGACLAAGAQAFLTNDRQLLRLGDRLDVIVLEDWIGEDEKRF